MKEWIILNVCLSLTSIWITCAALDFENNSTDLSMLSMTNISLHLPVDLYNNTRSNASISCETTEIVVDLMFDEPFLGRVALENDPKTRGCSFWGNGSTEYQFRIPIRGCGTKREEYLYSNTMMIIYGQRNVLAEGDQKKIILCQYPTPVAPAFIEVRRERKLIDHQKSESRKLFSFHGVLFSCAVLSFFRSRMW
ncbi:hypothetical protein RvY_02649 [Ramazzottius varieornatus]|uniref:ZP domain-containing protein n=1 Tax=Ramazzottius varieornatus TaxID=947166 RepID=A0A1D1UVL2_RAMVA|nr:hypothetical protein RvY_02649 [Ramazzottius varieornatus]